MLLLYDLPFISRNRLQREMLIPRRYSSKPSRCTRTKRASGELTMCPLLSGLKFNAKFEKGYGDTSPCNCERGRCQEKQRWMLRIAWAHILRLEHCCTWSALKEWLKLDDARLKSPCQGPTSRLLCWGQGKIITARSRLSHLIVEGR